MEARFLVKFMTFQTSSKRDRLKFSQSAFALTGIILDFIKIETFLLTFRRLPWNSNPCLRNVEDEDFQRTS